MATVAWIQEFAILLYYTFAINVKKKNVYTVKNIENHQHVSSELDLVFYNPK